MGDGKVLTVGVNRFQQPAEGEGRGERQWGAGKGFRRGEEGEILTVGVNRLQQPDRGFGGIEGYCGRERREGSREGARCSLLGLTASSSLMRGGRRSRGELGSVQEWRAAGVQKAADRDGGWSRPLPEA